MKITNDFLSIPFEEIYTKYPQNIKDFFVFYGLRNKIVEYMPQLYKYLTKNFLQKPQNFQNKTILHKIFDFNSEFDRGLYLFLKCDNRSCWMDKQTLPNHRPYSALVPLILASFKQKFNMLYSEWPHQDLDLLVNNKLCSAMLYKLDKTYTSEELEQICQEGLEYKSGVKKGLLRPRETTHKLYNQNNELRKIPELQQVMLFKLWCAHEKNQHKMMVLNPSNWDEYIEQEVEKPQELFKKMPWD